MSRKYACRGVGPKAWGVVLAVLLAACQREAHEELSASASPEAAAVDSSARGALQAPEVVRAWLRDLEEAHRAADAAKDPTSRGVAVARLAELYERENTLPRDLPEIVELRQDLAVRAARLELAASDASAALAWVERGLALSEEPSVLAATLWMVAADAHETRGDFGEARRALHQALAINQQLLHRELEEP